MLFTGSSPFTASRAPLPPIKSNIKRGKGEEKNKENLTKTKGQKNLTYNREPIAFCFVFLQESSYSLTDFNTNFEAVQ